MDNSDLLAEHTRCNHLTTILGNAQMLRRRITRSTGLVQVEREILLQEIAALEQAVGALKRGPQLPALPTPEP